MNTRSVPERNIMVGAATPEPDPGPHSAQLRQVYERVLAGSSVRSRSVEVRGSRVHLLETGDGRPVVFLHGTTATAGMFLPLLDELRGVRAVLPDRPGHGLSDPIDLPQDRFREAVVSWIDGLLDALGLNTTAVLGHSGGGVWALWYALAHPNRVERLVLIAPPALPKTRCPLPIRVIATPGVGGLLSRLAPPTPKSVLQFARFMGEQTTLAAHPDLVDLFVATGRDRVADRVGRAEIRALASPLALLSPSGFRRRSRVRPDELRQVAMPTLMVWGEQEPLGSVAVAQAATDLIPHARLQVLPTGHAPWLGEPAQTAKTVVEFITEVSA
jgi:pimeloyl-ACP methyl ester carboxylesterase